MQCDGCKYNGGLVKSDTTYSGMHMVCNAPEEHIQEYKWCHLDGAVLQGMHCRVLG